MSSAQGTKTVIEAEIKIGRRKFCVRYLAKESGCQIVQICNLTGRDEKKIVEFTSKLWTAPKDNPEELVGWCDSYSGEDGEIAYQMFSPKVYRKPYPAGKIIMSSVCDVFDEALLQTEGLMETAIQTLLSGLKKELGCKTPIYFTYLGIDSLSEDVLLRSVFKNNHFAVFFCVNGLCCDDHNFIALYSSDVIGDDFRIQQQAATRERPKENENGYIDYRYMGNVRDIDRYVFFERKHQTVVGNIVVKAEFYPGEGASWGESFLFNVFSTDTSGNADKCLLGANFYVVHFGLVGSEILERLIAADNAVVSEVGKQLFYPPVERDPCTPGRLVLLNQVKFRHEDVFSSNPQLLRDVFAAVVEELDAELSCLRGMMSELPCDTYLAYFGRLAVADEDIEQLEFEFQKDEAREKRVTDKAIYDLCKKAEIPVVRCINKGKSEFGQDDFIAFVSAEELIWEEEDGELPAPVEEFPKPILKSQWKEMVKREKNRPFIEISKERRERVFRYDVWDDVFGEYVARDLFYKMQEDAYSRNK